jgi:hypothetical protein
LLVKKIHLQALHVIFYWALLFNINFSLDFFVLADFILHLATFYTLIMILAIFIYKFYTDYFIRFNFFQSLYEASSNINWTVFLMCRDSPCETR